MSALSGWLARQETVHARSIDLGLDRLRVVAHALRLEKPAPLVITVAGTNGKGSTVAMLEQLSFAAGLTAGTFTSPHLFRYNERIRIADREASDDELIAAFERIDAARDGVTLTFFEYNALAAFLLLRDARVDIAILEVGLGGRLDAVNLIDADVAVLCSIGLDHRDWLGPTLEHIGREKAGVFRRDAPAIFATADLPESVYTAATEIAARPRIAGRDYYWRERFASAQAAWSYEGDTLSLHNLRRPGIEGSAQLRNAAAALATLESLGLADGLDAAAVTAALQRTRLPGRFQRVVSDAHGVEWIFDVAHNAAAAHALTTNLAALPGARTIAIVGILSDKDAPAIASALCARVDEWILCTIAGARGQTATVLGELLGEIVKTPRLATSVAEGCELARSLARGGDRIVVFGSFHTVGPALEFLRLY